MHDSGAAVDLVQGNLKVLFFRMETKTRLGALVLEVGKKATVRRTKQRKGQNHIRSGGSEKGSFSEGICSLGNQQPVS